MFPFDPTKDCGKLTESVCLWNEVGGWVKFTVVDEHTVQYADHAGVETELTPEEAAEQREIFTADGYVAG